MLDTRLSLIVCTYRRPQAIGRLLSALASQARRPDEILIVDGSDDSATESLIASLQASIDHANVVYFRVSPEHRGLTRQRNFGIARASGNIVAFLDDDTVPASDYFEQVLACFERHPEGGGVGGYIDGTKWNRVTSSLPPPGPVFRWGAWERREDYRWQLRKALGLVSHMPPGVMPPSGHGRPVGFFPPDGEDYGVEFLMGGASVWRSRVLEQEGFSPFFEGYGLYEDLDFCIRASRRAPLYFCTRARVSHYHEAAGRPRPFHYGKMVVRNGWYVWRLRWPSPPLVDRFRWWCTTILLTFCRLADWRGSRKADGIREAAGRLAGVVSVLWSPPSVPANHSEPSTAIPVTIERTCE